MKCQILFSGKNKKNISKCRLLKILPRVLSVNRLYLVWLALNNLIYKWKSVSAVLYSLDISWKLFFLDLCTILMLRSNNKKK